MKILFVASEVAPYRKTGGLADVAGSLPKALAERGHDVRVVMPLYQSMPWRDLELLDGILRVPMYHGDGRAAVRLGHLPDSEVRVYCIEHRHYFDRPHPYGPPGDAYPDNLERFAFFSSATLALANALGFVPDVVHTHDWQTGLVPVYLDEPSRGPVVSAASLHTIHNLAYQGNFDLGASFITGLDPANQPACEHLGQLNLLKAGISRAQQLTTVSPTYAHEIRQPRDGFGLDGALAARGDDLRGVLNGIDTAEWDPATDPHIAARYRASDLSGKAECKEALQRELGLPVRADRPLFAAIGRLTHQKGFDYLADGLDRLFTWPLQFVLLGTGDPEAEHFFSDVTARHGDRFQARCGYDPALVHRIEAGADFLVMPSRFEPCGLNQMFSLRYGTLPIVHGTGGLADTVKSYDERTGAGTGFVFRDLSRDVLCDAIGWAMSTWFDRPHHFRAMRRLAMLEDFSWDRSAAQYEEIYEIARRRRRGAKAG